MKVSVYLAIIGTSLLQKSKTITDKKGSYLNGIGLSNGPPRWPELNVTGNGLNLFFDSYSGYDDYRWSTQNAW